MSRQGVLSDLAIKQRYPEHYPLDIGSQEYLHPIHMQKHIFKGIKVPKKTKKYTTIARYPLNDLKNFSQFGSAERAEEALYYSIMNYRKELGSNNVPNNLETAYQQRIKADYVPAPMFRPEEDSGGVQVGTTLSLGRRNRKEGQDMFSKTVPGSRSFLSARMRATLSNISEEDDYPLLMSYLVSGGLPNKITDEEAKSKLNKIYRDDPEQLNVIEQAWHQAGSQEILTIPTSVDE